jgi:hypothetical protein
MPVPLARSLSLEARYALLELEKENNRLLCRALAAEHEAAQLRRKLEMVEITSLCMRDVSFVVVCKGDCDE